MTRVRAHFRVFASTVALIAAFAQSPAWADLWVEGTTTGRFENNLGGDLSDNGRTYSFGGRPEPTTFEINAPDGEFGFEGNTTFESTIGTITWSNLARDGLLGSYRAVDALWNFQVTSPANSADAETFGGTLNIFNLAFLPDATTSVHISSLIGSTMAIEHAAGILTVEMLKPTVTGDGGLLGGSWVNGEGGESTLHLKARFTNSDNGIGSSVVTPAPGSLTLFGIGAVGLAVIGLRRKRQATPA